MPLWWLMENDRTFWGGMSLEIDPAWGMRRVNTTMGLARLRISEERVWLGTWLVLIPKQWRSVEHARSEVREVFRSKSLLLSSGVGIAALDGKTHYFWTLRPRAALAMFRKTGYSIGRARRPTGTLGGQFPFPRRRTGV